MGRRRRTTPAAIATATSAAPIHPISKSRSERMTPLGDHQTARAPATVPLTPHVPERHTVGRLPTPAPMHAPTTVPVSSILHATGSRQYPSGQSSQGGDCEVSIYNNPGNCAHNGDFAPACTAGGTRAPGEPDQTQTHSNDESSWYEMYRRLESFCKENGRGTAPLPTTTLGAWTAAQRADRRHGDLSREREAALARIGFEWAPHWSGVTWGQRYAELVEFYRAQGHCRVRYSGGGLGGWVSTQRRAKKAGRLSMERMQKLDDIGFIWDARPDGDPCRTGASTETAAQADVTENRNPFSRQEHLQAVEITRHQRPGADRAPDLDITHHRKTAPEDFHPQNVHTMFTKDRGICHVSRDGTQESTFSSDMDTDRLGGVTALTHAVNKAVEEHHYEYSDLQNTPTPPTDESGATTPTGVQFHRVPSSPGSLPAKKRLRACSQGLFQPLPLRPRARSPPPSSAVAVLGQASVCTAELATEGEHEHQKYIPVEVPPPGVESHAQAVVDDDGVRSRVRALVSEIVAETLSPKHEHPDSGANCSTTSSQLRQWAQHVYVDLTRDELDRVITDSVAHRM
jgi:Helicase associated domain